MEKTIYYRKRIGNHTQVFEWYEFERPLTQISRWQYYSTSHNSKTVQVVWSIDRLHFQWPWTTPTPSFKDTTFFDVEHLRNGMTYSFNEILIGTSTCPTQQCHFEWPWVTKQNIQWHEASRGLSICNSWASCFDKKWANWHNFEKDAAKYFDTSHQVFTKLDSRTVEKQNEQLSATAIKYSNELKFAYGRVRVRLGYALYGLPYA